MLKLFDPVIPKSGLIGGRLIKRWLKKHLGNKTFYGAKIPFKVVAYDLIRREDIIYNSGSLVEAVRRSIAIPGVIEPVLEGDQVIIDGGVLNPLPTNVLTGLGIKKIIAVNVLQSPEDCSEGFDIAQEVIDYAQKNNLNAFKQDLMNFKTNKKYDLIIMFDVVEHLENPNKALQKYKEMLTPNGLLYIQVPDLIGFRIPWNHGYGLPFHLWQFNFQSMAKLLRKNRFKVLGRWNGPIGVVGDYEKGKNIFFKKIMWKLTSKLHISPRLQVIAKRG